MTEKEVSRKCKVEFVQDPVKGWKIVLDDPSCKRSLEQVSQKLKKHGKKYLAKRIETSNPEVLKLLETLGLAVEK